MTGFFLPQSPAFKGQWEYKKQNKFFCEQTKQLINTNDFTASGKKSIAT